jgi:four helix bundle protein
MALAELCYQRTSCFPAPERYGLVSQIRRAAVSVASNIAEGHSRRSLPAYLNHLSIALGSQAELETQIELSRRLGYLHTTEASEISDLLDRLGRRLHALMQSLEKRQMTPQTRVPSTQHPAPSPRSLAPSTQSPAPSTYKEAA